jgi:hypothetical protein
LVHNPDRPAGVILQRYERAVVRVFAHVKINGFTERLGVLITSRRNTGSTMGGVLSLSMPQRQKHKRED